MNVVWADESGLSANDRGLCYGDGLFETIRMQGRQGALLGRHLRRLAADAQRLGILIEPIELNNACRVAAERYADQFAGHGWVLKLILSRGPGGRGYRPAAKTQPQLLISAGDLPALPSASGVAADYSTVMLTVNPLLAGMKTLNRLEQVMAARDLTESVFELIMCDQSGHPVEGTRTNLLVKTATGWATPPVSAVAVAGVMRQWVLECLRGRAERVEERALTPDDITAPKCQGLYLLSSVLGVVPVNRLAGIGLPVAGGLATICDLLTTLENAKC